MDIYFHSCWMESSEFRLIPWWWKTLKRKKMTRFHMSFASEEAVMMLFFVARETEPWTPVSAGGGGKDVISLLSSICNCDLWSEAVNGLGLRASPSSSLSKLCVVCPTSFCLFPCWNECEGWSLVGWVAGTGRWHSYCAAEGNGGLGAQAVKEGDCTSLTLPVTSWEIPRLPYVCPVVKSENRNRKVTCRYQKAESDSDAGAS